MPAVYIDIYTPMAPAIGATKWLTILCVMSKDTMFKISLHKSHEIPLRYITCTVIQSFQGDMEGAVTLHRKIYFGHIIPMRLYISPRVPPRCRYDPCHSSRHNGKKPSRRGLNRSSNLSRACATRFSGGIFYFERA